MTAQDEGVYMDWECVTTTVPLQYEKVNYFWYSNKEEIQSKLFWSFSSVEIPL